MENELVTKDVEFNGDLLKAVQDLKSKKIYVGISWVCNGIGLTEKQKDNQVSKFRNDIVLKNGCLQLPLKYEGQTRNALCVELDYLPLWLAKISITPTMKKETPKIVNKLVNYQLKAKDVLAEAFIHKEDVKIDNFQIPTTLSEALLLSANLAKENEEMKPKAEQFDLYLDSSGTLSMNETAKALKTKRNKMMEYLRYKGILNQDNSPNSYCSNHEYFEVKGYSIRTKGENKYEIFVTRVTPKGKDFLYRYLKKNTDEYSRFDPEYKNVSMGGNK